MYRRRAFLSIATLLFASGPGVARTARAQSAADTAAATSFIRATGQKLVNAINGTGSAEAKSKALTGIVDRDVDVDGIARFCLGRFWRVATPAERTQYQQLFHHVLVLNVTAKIGDYRGVTVAVGRAVPRAEGVMVATTVTRPGKAPAEVDWLVKQIGGTPKIIDVVAEGTSLRVTQRSDYASFMSRHNDNVAALITALRAQVAQPG
ncbi:MAG: MlaC/ttg2D family ABC transporter substrate-binding protein [Acetobacteraceae bacterium]